MDSPCSEEWYSVGADIGALEITLALRDRFGRIHYKHFPLSDRDQLLETFQAFECRVLPSVGSGSWRLSEILERETGIMIEKHREPVCIWTAIEKLLKPGSGPTLPAFRFDYSLAPSAVRYPISAPYPARESVQKLMVPVPLSDLSDSFPILLVIVKTGTSFYRMDSPSDFVRVGGSSIGASTLMALGNALVARDSVEGITQRATALEEHSVTDLLVEDIYGGDCDSIGLPGSIIASCLGKASAESTDSADLAKSLTDLMSINTAQLANLHARLHKCKTAVVVGALTEEMCECMQRVLHILSKNSSEVLKAVFFKDSKYLGCLGALLRRERLISELSGRNTDVVVSTATVADGLDDETYTKLRICTPPVSVVHAPVSTLQPPVSPAHPHVSFI
jgi:type II pantothenate kinase